MEGWVDLGYPAMHRSGVDHLSDVLTTTLPSHTVVVRSSSSLVFKVEEQIVVRNSWNLDVDRSTLLEDEITGHTGWQHERFAAVDHVRCVTVNNSQQLNVHRQVC